MLKSHVSPAMSQIQTQTQPSWLPQTSWKESEVRLPLRNVWSSSQSEKPLLLQEKGQGWNCGWAELACFRGWGLPEDAGTSWAEENQLPSNEVLWGQRCVITFKGPATYQWVCCQRVRPVLSDPCVRKMLMEREHVQTPSHADQRLGWAWFKLRWFLISAK